MGDLEMRSDRSRRLGMGRPITRRDFIDGIAVTAAVAASAPVLGAIDSGETAIAPQDRPDYYPPALMGMRGSHPGSFETAHALRDGTFPKSGANLVDTGEQYDLIVVGAGISGLAAAYFYRARTGVGARILILDNHDDFGGHSKRNEFALGGKIQLINGGTLAIDSPRPYSAVAAGLLTALGIDPVALSSRHADRGFYPSLGLGPAVFFDRENFGEDRLVKGTISSPGFLEKAPLSKPARRDIRRLETEPIDHLPGLSSAEKKARLSRMSYRDYLLDVVTVDPSVIPLYQSRTHGEWGVGIDAVSALDVWPFGLPGFQGLQLAPGSAPRMGYTPAGYADGGSDTFHFPDGNASIARLLVRSLIPQAVPGGTVEDVVTARIDYSRLDRPDDAIRIRLGSLAVSVAGSGSAAVEIVYSRMNRLHTVRAKHCALACWNMMIPYLCPQLPQKQKEALGYLAKVPLVYTNVALANWRAFASLGVGKVHCPGSYHTSVKLNPVTNIGAYQAPRSPDEPILVQMVRTPCRPGLSERDQHRAGRYELLATEFAIFEEKIRDQLDRMLSPSGFDAAHDIAAITVNRWPHGYAYEYNSLFDPEWEKGEAPHEVGRARSGPIAIANSDSAAAAYTDAAIDQAHRAVEELLTR
ncbi:MAG: FAD-dependent oxidoreductase [Alphaproteobacteria bacterium]|nr:MAG: FAD-dependent oxidoreductase [Alphaproteobacteria bacterium]